MGPSRETLRELRRPSSWRGLSADDGTILAVWAAGWAEPPLEFHTDIPLGSFPEGATVPCDCSRESFLENVYCRRADALVVWPGRWDLVEAKPYGTPQALGQILHYGFLIRDLVPPAFTLRLMVVGQFMGGECDRFYAEHGVIFHSVGQVLQR